MTAGELDYETTDDFVNAVTRLLGQQPRPPQVRINLAELTFCDSAGLSGLLLMHRRAGEAGVDLHLDPRPGFLDRMLEITGTFEHLVPAARRDENAPGETGVR